jgi:hypothetical protein
MVDGLNNLKRLNIVQSTEVSTHIHPIYRIISIGW